MRGSEWTIRATTAYRVVPDRPTGPPETEAKTCGTCYHYDPCPCGRCGWGVCRYFNNGRCFNDNDYTPEDSSCCHWKEA